MFITEFQTLIRSLLNVDVQRRFDIVETLNHEWNFQISTRPPGRHMQSPHSIAANINAGNPKKQNNALPPSWNPFQSVDILSNLKFPSPVQPKHPKNSSEKVNIKVRGDKHPPSQMYKSHKTSITQSPHSIAANINTGHSSKQNPCKLTHNGLPPSWTPFQSIDILNNLKVPSHVQPNCAKESFNQGNIEVQGGESLSKKMLISHKTSTMPSPHSIANINTGNSTIQPCQFTNNALPPSWNPFQSVDILSNLKPPPLVKDSFNKGNVDVQGGKKQSHQMQNANTTTTTDTWNPFQSQIEWNLCERSKLDISINNPSTAVTPQSNSDKPIVPVPNATDNSKRWTPFDSQIAWQCTPMVSTSAKLGVHECCSKENDSSNSAKPIVPVPNAMDNSKGWTPFDSQIAWQCTPMVRTSAKLEVHECCSKENASSFKSDTQSENYSSALQPKHSSNATKMQQNLSNASIVNYPFQTKPWTPFDSPSLLEKIASTTLPYFT